MRHLTWLDDWSVASVSAALGEAAPELTLQSLTLSPVTDFGYEEWATGCAVVNGAHVAKFALSQPTAGRVWDEGQVIAALSRRPLAVPRVTAISTAPVMFVSDLIPGVPLSSELLGAAVPSRVDELGCELGRFLAALHDEKTYDSVAEVFSAGTVPPPAVPVQATTDELRAGLPELLRADQLDFAMRGCDWVDAVLERPDPPVYVHGDLHGYNQVWEPRRLQLRLVADFEAGGAAEPEYDFRYIPALGPGVSLLRSTIGHYRRFAERELDVARILAWHVRTVLGDALWRSQAGVALPGGGTPPEWADDLARRFEALAITP